MSHTPTPWSLGPGFQIVRDFGDKPTILYLSDAAPRQRNGTEELTHNEMYHNAQRIVECVNALEGVVNPAEVRDFLVWICHAYKLNLEDHQFINYVSLEANRLLRGEPKKPWPILGENKNAGD